jgi:hypothetical protein
MVNDHLNKTIKNKIIPEKQRELTEQLRKLGYPGYLAPFSSTIIEINEREEHQEGTEREIKEGDIFPLFIKSDSVAWVYLSQNVSLQFTDIKL